MRLEEKLGMRSSYNFVPERYQNSPSIRKLLVSRGFEIGVHGLKHDSKLFRSKRIFMKRAKQINQYLRDWKTSGFSSPSMHHNLVWMPMLDIKHLTSTFDMDPFEPYSEGVRTIFPFWVKGHDINNGYVELPYTLPQDFTLFILMQESDIRIWKRKLDC
jgi:peptidoglycan/xylan/chitin deacetylase (PgdA/CDA1 family)